MTVVRYPVSTIYLQLDFKSEKRNESNLVSQCFEPCFDDV